MPLPPPFSGVNQTYLAGSSAASRSRSLHACVPGIEYCGIGITGESRFYGLRLSAAIYFTTVPILLAVVLSHYDHCLCEDASRRLKSSYPTGVSQFH
jgi:hypothetical protein